MHTFSLISGWGITADEIDWEGTVGEIMDAHGFESVFEVSGYSNDTILGIWREKGAINNNGRHIVEFRPFDGWVCVQCDSLPAAMQLYSQWAAIAIADKLAHIEEMLGPVELAAQDTDAWRSEVRRMSEMRKPRKVKADAEDN